MQILHRLLRRLSDILILMSFLDRSKPKIPLQSDTDRADSSSMWNRSHRASTSRTLRSSSRTRRSLLSKLYEISILTLTPQDLAGKVTKRFRSISATSSWVSISMMIKRTSSRHSLYSPPAPHTTEASLGSTISTIVIPKVSQAQFFKRIFENPRGAKRLSR